MKKPALLFLSALCASVGFSAQASIGQDAEISALVKFLVSDGLVIKGKDGQSVALSYYIGTQDDIDKYFGDFICQAQNTCTVVDHLYSNPYAILGKGLPPMQGTQQETKAAQAQIERSDMKYGADVYDAATWQIALALAAKNGYLDKSQAQQWVQNQQQSILNSEARATDKSFQYGYSHAITDPTKAFTFRMIATNYSK